MNALAPGPGPCQHRGKNKVSSSKLKTKKTMWVFLFQKYGEFGSVSLGHFIKRKPLFSEEFHPN